MATAIVIPQPQVKAARTFPSDSSSSLGALRLQAPILAKAFGGLLGAQEIVEPFFASVRTAPNPLEALRAQETQIRDQLIAAVFPRMEQTGEVTSAGSDLLDAAKHGLIEGVKAAWQEALAAGVAALPAGPDKAAAAFVKTLVVQGAKPALDAFLKKYEELKKKRAESAEANPSGYAAADHVEAGFLESAGAPALAKFRIQIRFSPASESFTLQTAGGQKNRSHRRVRSLGLPPELEGRVKVRLGSPRLPEDKRLLDLALASQAPRQALELEERLTALAADGGAIAERLTPLVREALVRGISDLRSPTEMIPRTLLTPEQADRAVAVLSTLTPAEAAQIETLLSAAGAPIGGSVVQAGDVYAERALILKALAARVDQLGEGHSEARAQAMAELVTFAEDVRGLSRSELLRTTTLISLEPDKTGARSQKSHAQPFTTGCVPDMAQVVRAEGDPAYARRLRRDSTEGFTPTAVAIQEQKDLLEHRWFLKLSDETATQLTPEQEIDFERHGKLPRGVISIRGVAVTPEDAAVYEDVSKLLGKADWDDVISFQEKDALLEFIRGRDLDPEQIPLVEPALAKVREYAAGRLSDEEIEQARRGAVRPSASFLHPLLEQHAAGVWNTSYELAKNDLSGKRSGAFTRIEAALERQIPVPFGVDGSLMGIGHAAVILGMTGQGEARRYIVYDPESGTAAPVTRDQLLRAGMHPPFSNNWESASRFCVPS